MIKICDYEICFLDINTNYNREIEKIYKDNQVIKNNIIFLLQDQEMICAALKPEELYMYNGSKGNCLYHSVNVFKEANDYFKLNDHSSLLPVLKQNGELYYILENIKNITYQLFENGTFYKSYDNYLEINDENLDFTLLNRSFEGYIFYEMEEYTYNIAKLIRKHFPNRKLIFLDKHAAYFFNHNEVIICTDANDVIELTGSEGKYLIIVSKFIDVEAEVPSYLSNIYTSLSIMDSLYWSSKEVSYGENNPDKTFLLVDCNMGTAGLMDIIRFAISCCILAEERNYIPYILLDKKPNQYIVNDGDNMWEYYFEQFCNYTKEEIFSSKHIISISDNDNGISMSWKNPYIHEKIKILYSNYNKNNIFISNLKINYATNRFLEENLLKEIDGRHRVLGVMARGTDFRLECLKARKARYKVNNCDVDTLIEIAKYMMQSKKCDYLYLATEDKEYFDKFSNAFGNQLIYSEQERAYYKNDSEKNLPVSKLLNLSDGFTFGKKYLSVCYCLSKCNIFVASMDCGASYLARLLNQEMFELDKNALDLM